MRGFKSSYQPIFGFSRLGQSVCSVFGCSHSYTRCALVFRHNDCNRYRSRVRQAQRDPPYPQCSRNLGRPPAQMQLRPASRQPCHLEFRPAHTPADAGSQRFCTSLFRRESRRQAFRRILLPLAIRNLAWRVDALQKRVAKALHATLDPCNFNQIRSQANHHGSCLHLQVYPASRVEAPA